MINEFLDGVRPYLSVLGVGTTVAMGTHVALSTLRGLRNGTTFMQQLGNPVNGFIASAAGGATCAAISLGTDHRMTYETLDTVMQYVGAAGAGIAIGAVARPVFRALSTTEGITDNLGQRVREGAIRGAIAFPAGYAALNVLSGYIR